MPATGYDKRKFSSIVRSAYTEVILIRQLWARPRTSSLRSSKLVPDMSILILMKSLVS
jgi:hypothetical protein